MNLLEWLSLVCVWRGGVEGWIENGDNKKNDNNRIIMSITCIAFTICQCSKCFLYFSSFNPHKSTGSY